MRAEIGNRLTMLKAEVTARCPPSDPDRFAWVWVSPSKEGGFIIGKLEVSRQHLDDEELVSEDHHHSTKVAMVSTIEEVDRIVEGLGVDPDSLDVPWKNDFPD